MEILIIDKSILPFDENVEEAYVDNDPEANEEVTGANHDSQTLAADCDISTQMDVFFQTFHSDDKVRLIFYDTSWVGLVSRQN